MFLKTDASYFFANLMYWMYYNESYEELGEKLNPDQVPLVPNSSCNNTTYIKRVEANVSTY